ncbi:MAG: hypothetical protein ACFFAY_03455 [Promethearchaeota archaeon]
MKPLGTITMCFPHVDDETRNIPQSVMGGAENFADFAKRLYTLVHLTDMEIERVILASAADSSGPWMQEFEEYVEAREAPGFAGRLLILKAKLQQKQGQYDEVSALLKKVQKIAETPSMKYLNNLVAATFSGAVRRYLK